MYGNNRRSEQVWAVLDAQGRVVWSRGGSSSVARPMLYDSQLKAERALSNPWIRQVHDVSTLTVRCVYAAPPDAAND